MEQSSRTKLLPLAVAAFCGALAAIAVFGRARWPDQGGGRMGRADSAGSALARTLNIYACPGCGRSIEWGTDFCGWCGWNRLRLMTPAALPPPAAPAAGRETEVEVNAARNRPPAVEVEPAARATNPATAQPAAAAPNTQLVLAAAAAPSVLLSPREQNAAGKEFIEGHWLGLEVIPLTPELATEYRVPQGEKGILVDEITLEAAESGILAGDMVQSVDGRPTPDLRAFFLATQRVQEKERADVGISRRGEPMTFFMEARNTKTLGFAQMEAAQPIKPGAITPHRARSKSCTECHIIMAAGGQLPTDAGDILPNPPAITKAATPTHANRGECAACHVIR